jgi:hypothetical protein
VSSVIVNSFGSPPPQQHCRGTAVCGSHPDGSKRGTVDLAIAGLASNLQAGLVQMPETVQAPSGQLATAGIDR